MTDVMRRLPYTFVGGVKQRNLSGSAFAQQIPHPRAQRHAYT